MTWGKTITIKFYLNDKLKPTAAGDRKELYPVYVRVICKQQVSQFKYFGQSLEPLLLSKKEFKTMFGQIDISQSPLINQSEISQALAIAVSFKETVEFILNLVDAFERNDFSIQQLPNVMRSYYLTNQAFLKMLASSLISKMIKSGYADIVSIIDWERQNPVAIEMAMVSFQQAFKLIETRIDFDTLPFTHLKELLEIIKKESAGSKVKNEDLLKRLSPVFGRKPKVLPPALITDVIEKAANFYKEAFRLTSI